MFAHFVRLIIQDDLCNPWMRRGNVDGSLNLAKNSRVFSVIIMPLLARVMCSSCMNQHATAPFSWKAYSCICGAQERASTPQCSFPCKWSFSTLDVLAWCVTQPCYGLLSFRSRRQRSFVVDSTTWRGCRSCILYVVPTVVLGKFKSH